MSSPPTREKRFERPILLYFTGPMSPCLHSFPQLDAKYGCWTPVVSDRHFSRLSLTADPFQAKPMNALVCAEESRSDLLPSSSSSTFPLVMKCPRPAKSPSSSPSPPMSFTISSLLSPTHLLFHLFLMDDMSPLGFSCPQ